MNGKLYGVGVGPGDPELMTAKAVKIIEKCRIIAVPAVRGGVSLALSAAERSVNMADKEIVTLNFSMSRSSDKDKFAAAAEKLEEYLSEGTDAAMLCLGDVSVYSTFSYISDILAEKGFEIEFCPGVTSFSAVSAKFGKALVQGDEPLTVVPAGYGKLDSFLSLDGTKVIMKAGGHIPELKKKLAGMNVTAAESCGLENEKIYRQLADIPRDCGYFTTLIAKNGAEKAAADGYVIRGKKRLRCGFTTGSCAAAAAKAAAASLLSGERVSRVRIITPKGIPFETDTEFTDIDGDEASCGIKKDGGDDPDVTDKLVVCARVRRIPHGIEIAGGEGVGIVTRPGLDRPVGDFAINTVPREMIRREVSGVCGEYGYGGGIEITVYVPRGREIAAKTYNPRLGIEGGISVIGTSGIVEPMSTRALIDTIRTEMKQRRAEGVKALPVVMGGYGETYLVKNMPYAAERCVRCSNFIGEAADIAAELGFESILLTGHIGKLCKLALGIMNTHSSFADGRMEAVAACAVRAGCGSGTVSEILSCITADAALGILKSCGMLERTMEILTERAGYYLDLRCGEELKSGVVIFSNEYGLLGRTGSAEKIISQIKREGN
ncbi:MAG: cobalt-precorrin-5B (C(1))-methyltransferase CbiD [Ruminococcus sp.]|nr:cobalt-precorrin-5B (C(1))-methyltransferase CbiD [Ruminococcus sp.]